MSLKKTAGVSAFPTRGGVHAPHRKNTADCETVVMPPPEKILLSMSQHIGAPCVPVVKKGDRVEVGQLVADSDSPVTAPIHSGVSGTVTGTTELLLPGGKTAQALIIESDGQQTVHDSVRPPVIDTFEDFIAAVRASGAVGLGGAGFPTHVKLNPPDRDAIDTIRGVRAVHHRRLPGVHGEFLGRGVRGADSDGVSERLPGDHCH